ncbi:MAG: hypothetical protein RI897_1749 [Verrucomicrobiota bacterium]
MMAEAGLARLAPAFSLSTQRGPRQAARMRSRALGRGGPRGGVRLGGRRSIWLVRFS